MIKKIDWYIIKKFLGTFFFILALLMAISVIFDVSEKIDNFLRSSAPVKAILIDYYLNFVVYYSNLFSSLLVFIAVILFTARMAQQTEIVAILSAGVSFNRLLRPFMISATILTIMSMVFNHVIVPYSNKTLNQFKFKYVENKRYAYSNQVHREVEQGTIAYVESVDMEQFTAFRFSLEKWDKGRLKYKLLSDRAVFDTTKNVWQIRNYYERFIGDSAEKLITGIEKDTTLSLRLSDFTEMPSAAAEMGWSELRAYINKEKLKGSDKVAFYEVELHQRSSLPLATYILTLLGVSIASRKVRGGIGMHIAAGILMAVVYIFFMKVATVAATNSGVNPFVAVWIPNVIFGLITAVVYYKAPK